jgi:hypothetical protein
VDIPYDNTYGYNTALPILQFRLSTGRHGRDVSLGDEELRKLVG